MAISIHERFQGLGKWPWEINLRRRNSVKACQKQRFFALWSCSILKEVDRVSWQRAGLPVAALGPGGNGPKGSSSFTPACGDMMIAVLLPPSDTMLCMASRRLSVVGYLTSSGKGGYRSFSACTARLAAAMRRAEGGLGCSPRGVRFSVQEGRL
jgi:hypothetical protein